MIEASAIEFWNQAVTVAGEGRLWDHWNRIIASGLIYDLGFKAELFVFWKAMELYPTLEALLLHGGNAHQFTKSLTGLSVVEPRVTRITNDSGLFGTVVGDDDRGQVPGWTGPHLCAIQEQGQVFCFGRNQFGSNTNVNSAFLVQMLGVEHALDVSVGLDHTCLVERSILVKCTGGNEAGTLGDGTLDSSLVLVQVGLEPAVVEVFASYQHTCALLVEDGGVVFWGANEMGALGDGASPLLQVSPVLMANTKRLNIQQLALGYAHTCLVTMQGQVQCTGWNWYGQLGDGTRVDRDQLIPVLATVYVCIEWGVSYVCNHE
ncbi:hypothetical protein BASA82_000228 [Batrachochytrium salamandrivorans]|nr:hypothetical protein BASA82_000228 [Batrachochytrium salamandrivorans]